MGSKHSVKPKDIDYLLATAQVGFFFISLIGFIGILYFVVLGDAKLDPTSEKLAYTMLGVLGTIVTQQAGFFYQRHRPQALPDPSTTTTITTPTPQNPEAPLTTSIEVTPATTSK